MTTVKGASTAALLNVVVGFTGGNLNTKTCTLESKQQKNQEMLKWP